MGNTANSQIHFAQPPCILYTFLSAVRLYNLRNEPDDTGRRIELTVLFGAGRRIDLEEVFIYAANKIFFLKPLFINQVYVINQVLRFAVGICFCRLAKNQKNEPREKAHPTFPLGSDPPTYKSSSQITQNPNPSPIGFRFGFACCGGPEGDRTLDLRVANAALSQLSYEP